MQARGAESNAQRRWGRSRRTLLLACEDSPLFVPILVTAPFVQVSLALEHTSASCESDSRCPMRWRRRYSDSRLLETRNNQGSWEVTLYNLLPQVLRWFYWRKTATSIDHYTNSDLSFTTIQQQTYHRKQLMDQTDDNSLTALLTKRAQIRFCEVVNACTERRAEKRIQRMVWILSYVLRKTLREHVNRLCQAGWLNEQSITKHWFQSVRTCPYDWTTGRNSCNARCKVLL